MVNSIFNSLHFGRDTGEEERIRATRKKHGRGRIEWWGQEGFCVVGLEVLGWVTVAVVM